MRKFKQQVPVTTPAVACALACLTPRVSPRCVGVAASRCVRVASFCPSNLHRSINRQDGPTQGADAARRRAIARRRTFTTGRRSVICRASGCRGACGRRCSKGRDAQLFAGGKNLRGANAAHFESNGAHGDRDGQIREGPVRLLLWHALRTRLLLLNFRVRILVCYCGAARCD